MKRSYLSRGGCFLILLVVEVLWVTVLNPQNVPSYGFIVPFLLLFGLLYLAIMQLLAMIRSVESEKVVGLRIRRPRVVAGFTAAFPVILLVLKSIDQLTWADLAATTALFVVGYIYITRSAVSLMDFKKR